MGRLLAGALIATANAFWLCYNITHGNGQMIVVSAIGIVFSAIVIVQGATDGR